MRPKTYTYLHLNENLDPEDYVICDYRVTTDLPIEKAADAKPRSSPPAHGRVTTLRRTYR